jgi:hypothetical protein
MIPPLLPASLPRPEDIFNDDFYHQVFSNPTAAIRYINLFSTLLHDELKRAQSTCSSALVPPYRPLAVSRSIRDFVRAFTANVEGTIGFASFFMRAVRRRTAKVSLPPKVQGEPVSERLVRVLTAFSRAFGEDHQPTLDADWPAFKSMFEIRDRLTHPRSAADLELDLPHLEIVLQALGWYVSCDLTSLSLNEQKIADCIGSRRPQHNQAFRRLSEGAS